MTTKINTDDLRTLFDGDIHFNCSDGDEAFTDEYTMWLEEKLLDIMNPNVRDIVKDYLDYNKRCYSSHTAGEEASYHYRNGMEKVFRFIKYKLIK